ATDGALATGTSFALSASEQDGTQHPKSSEPFISNQLEICVHPGMRLRTSKTQCTRYTTNNGPRRSVLQNLCTGAFCFNLPKIMLERCETLRWRASAYAFLHCVQTSVLVGQPPGIRNRHDSKTRAMKHFVTLEGKRGLKFSGVTNQINPAASPVPSGY